MDNNQALRLIACVGNTADLIDSLYNSLPYESKTLGWDITQNVRENLRELEKEIEKEIPDA